MKNSSAFAIPTTRHQPGWHLPGHNDKLTEGLKALTGAALQTAKLGAAVFLAGMAAWCATALTSIGFDWGYELVGKVAGQPDSPQGVVAAMALWFVVMPTAFSLAFACLKTAWRGSWLWNLIPALMITSFSIYDMVTLEATAEDLLSFTPWAGSALVVSTASLLLGSKIYQWLSARTNAAPVILPGFLVCLPAGVLLWAHDNNFAWTLELVCYATALLLAGFAAAFAGKTTRFSYGAAFALISTLPLILPCLLNVGGNVISLALDSLGAGAQLGWRALFSAAIIAIVSIASAISGGLGGTFWRGHYGNLTGAADSK